MREQRIKIWMGWALIITAMCVDLAEFGITWIGAIGPGGFVSSVFAVPIGFGFWVWLSMLGVNKTIDKGMVQKFFVEGSGFLLEIIPGLDAIPFSFFWTIAMILTVGMTRMEDKGENPTILGALSNIISVTSFNPGQMIADKARKRVSRSFERKSQEPIGREGVDDTIVDEHGETSQDQGNVVEIDKFRNDIQSKFKKAA